MIFRLASTFTGTKLIAYRVIEPDHTLQIDLQSPMKITRVSKNGNPLDYEQDWQTRSPLEPERRVEVDRDFQVAVFPITNIESG